MNITVLASGIKIEDLGLGGSGLDYPGVPSIKTQEPVQAKTLPQLE